MSESVTLSLTGDKELRQKLANIDSKLELGLKIHIAKTASAIHKDAQSKAPTGVTSQLRNTLFMAPVGSSAFRVVAPMKYAKPVEYGRKPGKMPPPGALELWGYRVLGRKGLGFALARAIARKGTQPQPFFWPAVKEHEAAYFSGAREILKDVTG